MKNIDTTKRSHLNTKQKKTGQSMRLFGYATLFASAILTTACATPVGEVASWPITNAETNELSGQVVDVMCELGGNCADNCGDGKRQLAIKTVTVGTVLVSKNLNNYSGGADELSPFCNQNVTINGLFTEHQGVRFFQIQNIRPPGGSWQRANRYLQAWSERSGKPPSNDWQDQDERVKEIIERDGRLGLGPDADDEYFN